MPDKTDELYSRFEDMAGEYVAEDIDVEKLRKDINLLLDSAT